MDVWNVEVSASPEDYKKLIDSIQNSRRGHITMVNFIDGKWIVTYVCKQSEPLPAAERSTH